MAEPTEVEAMDEAKKAFELILRCCRNSPNAPNVLETIAWAANNGLDALSSVPGQPAAVESLLDEDDLAILREEQSAGPLKREAEGASGSPAAEETATIRLAVRTLQNACDRYERYPNQDAAGDLYVEAGRAVSMLLATPDGYDPELDRPIDPEAVS